VFDGTLITLHGIHHEGITMEDSHHGEHRHVSDLHEKDLVFDLVKADSVFAAMG